MDQMTRSLRQHLFTEVFSLRQGWGTSSVSDQDQWFYVLIYIQFISTNEIKSMRWNFASLILPISRVPPPAWDSDLSPGLLSTVSVQSHQRWRHWRHGRERQHPPCGCRVKSLVVGPGTGCTGGCCEVPEPEKRFPDIFGQVKMPPQSRPHPPASFWYGAYSLPLGIFSAQVIK